jgi:hypothetical protein
MGPIDEPMRIFSFADYTRTFGPPWDEDHPLGHAVSHFFTNGGSEAVVVRTVATATQAAGVTLKNGAATNVLTLSASSRGSWGTRTPEAGLEASVDYDNTINPDDLFRLVIRLFGINPQTNLSEVVQQEEFTNLSMSPNHPRYAVTTLGGARLAKAALAAPAPTSTVAGTSEGKSAIVDTVFSLANNTLRVSVDQGSPVDVILFRSDTVPGGSTPAKTPTQIRNEIDNAFNSAGLQATPSLSSGKLKLTSDSTGTDSAVVVTPAASGDASKDLTLGRAWGGKEVSGSAALRPAPSSTAAPAVAFTGPATDGPVGSTDIVPSAGIGGMYSLTKLMFPRFNLLCLPDLTTGNEQQLGEALSYCKREGAFLIIDSPRGGFSALPPPLNNLRPLGENGAVYFPRVNVAEVQRDGTPKMLDLPASGAVAGVIARTDSTRGIWKAPAGREAGIAGITDLTAFTDDRVSGQLNPRGINVLRTFPGAGTVVWGARTLKGDDIQASEHKYIPVRRLTNYIAASLYLGTQFAVFEPNDPDLWAQLRLAVGAFMRGLFRQGAFQQSTKRAESDSFFVLCDETTNPQSEIDLGRVNVVVGFAPLKPAEFVIITITQISQMEE